jgi:hypothetical protein
VVVVDDVVGEAVERGERGDLRVVSDHIGLVRSTSRRSLNSCVFMVLDPLRLRGLFRQTLDTNVDENPRQGVRL